MNKNNKILSVFMFLVECKFAKAVLCRHLEQADAYNHFPCRLCVRDSDVCPLQQATTMFL